MLPLKLSKKIKRQSICLKPKFKKEGMLCHERILKLVAWKMLKPLLLIQRLLLKNLPKAPWLKK